LNCEVRLSTFKGKLQKQTDKQLGGLDFPPINRFVTTHCKLSQHGVECLGKHVQTNFTHPIQRSISKMEEKLSIFTTQNITQIHRPHGLQNATS
jgi:hypothetical protein